MTLLGLLGPSQPPISDLSPTRCGCGCLENPCGVSATTNKCLICDGRKRTIRILSPSACQILTPNVPNALPGGPGRTWGGAGRDHLPCLNSSASSWTYPGRCGSMWDHPARIAAPLGGAVSPEACLFFFEPESPNKPGKCGPDSPTHTCPYTYMSKRDHSASLPLARYQRLRSQIRG